MEPLLRPSRAGRAPALAAVLLAWAGWGAPTARGQLVTVHAFIRPPQEPRGGRMVQAADGFLWGAAAGGGDFDAGVIFRVKPDGTDWRAMISFSGTSGPNRGKRPESGLIVGIDGNFYGTTTYGGANDLGTMYMVTPGGVLTTLIDFTGSGPAGNGYAPTGSLLQLGNGDIYGTTQYGGDHSAGSVFRFSSGIIQTLVSFDYNGDANRGALPVGGLVLADDGNLYGTTSQGGSFGGGTIYRVTTGGAISTIVDFTFNGANNRGASPTTSLVVGNDHQLYGVTQGGGTGGFGTVFKTTTGGVLTTLADFTGGDPVRGGAPIAPLLKSPDGTSFLGGTEFGGNGNAGTIFRITPAGGLTTLIDFTGTGGTHRGYALSTGFVLAADGNFYGTTELGGLNNRGTVFRLTPGGAQTTLMDFLASQANDRGALPFGGLAAGPDGYLYGMTTGGGSLQVGTVFKIAPDGALTTLVEFTGIDGANRGANPNGGLTWGNDGFFYGGTSRGGANDDGTLFKVTPAGALTTLIDFEFNGAANKGSQPWGNLVLAADGNLYGVTTAGGPAGNGTAFRLNPANGTLTTLVQFNGASGSNRGVAPMAGLFLGPGGLLYGTTTQGGANGFGTAFTLTTSGTITTLADFTSANASPIGGLVLGHDGLLYGTSAVGGTGSFGSIFRMTTAGAVTSLVSFTDNAGSFRGASPEASMVKDSAGNLYGTTYFGGAARSGAIFRYSSGGAFATLADLTGSGPQLNSGAAPAYATPIIGPSGNLYGTTSSGGPHGAGSIFRINLVTQAPRISAFAPAPNNTVVTAKGVAGATYFLQSTDDLTGLWTLISSAAVADSSGIVQFVDSRSPLPAQRFYRVISGP